MTASQCSIGIGASLLLAAALAARACAPPAAGETVPGQTQVAQAEVIYGTYMGDIGGAAAIAEVSYEALGDHALFSGRIRSGSYRYSFTSEIVGDSGYGDMLDQGSGQRFRVAISGLSPAGFMLTANPFEGTGQTSYYFRRRQ